MNIKFEDIIKIKKSCSSCFNNNIIYTYYLPSFLEENIVSILTVLGKSQNNNRVNIVGENFKINGKINDNKIQFISANLNIEKQKEFEKLLCIWLETKIGMKIEE